MEKYKTKRGSEHSGRLKLSDKRSKEKRNGLRFSGIVTMMCGSEFFSF